MSLIGADQVQKTDVRPLVAVLAGTYRQFKAWAEEHPELRCIYCDHRPKFHGLEFAQMVEVGTFLQRKDAMEIWLEVAPMVRHPAR